MAEYNYNQQMNIRYDHLELMDVPAIVAENKEKWFNQTLTKINCALCAYVVENLANRNSLIFSKTTLL